MMSGASLGPLKKKVSNTVYGLRIQQANPGRFEGHQHYENIRGGQVA